MNEPTHARRRLGVIGTFVWDDIHGRDPAQAPVAEWGGITYALAGLDAALADEWDIVPLIKVGSDLAQFARDYTATLRHLARDAGVIEVAHRNNRVTLRYESSERRSEQLDGFIPGWQWLGLKPLLADLDALYINLISGWELDLETAQLIRQSFQGPIYCDLHSLLLAVDTRGFRVPRGIADVSAWLHCFDMLQVNEDEMALLAPDAMGLAAAAMAAGIAVINVTLGSRGVVYFAAPGFERLSDLKRANLPAAGGFGGAIRTTLVPAASPSTNGTLDPTGCGDVWGATYFARLLAGDKLGDAIDAAMTAASRNLTHRGATSLASYLRGELSLT
ncbi:MAG: carbohydrate kinase family protein [Gemmatimonadota bacterium]|nr:carbohydrate kinase family protein [Gemmatimonadota bacterium]